MGYEISKIDAAVDQLDWAIRPFLNHGASVPAIILAGATMSERIVSNEQLNRALERDPFLLNQPTKVLFLRSSLSDRIGKPIG